MFLSLIYLNFMKLLRPFGLPGCLQRLKSDHVAYFLFFSDDGSVRLFKDQCDDEEDEGSFYTLINHKLVSAWNGLRDVQAWNRAGGHGLAALMPAAGTEGTMLQVGAWRLQGVYYRF